MTAISQEVQRDQAIHMKARPHQAEDYLKEEWQKSLEMMGKLRDNVPEHSRTHHKQLIRTLPQDVLDFYPELAAPGATEDQKYLGLWSLLKKHQGEVCLYVWSVCRVCLRLHQRRHLRLRFGSGAAHRCEWR